MKKRLIYIFFFLLLLNSASAVSFNPFYDSSRFYFKFNNSLLNNPAFTGFNSHLSINRAYASHTPNIPAIDGTIKPRDYIFSSELSFGRLVSFSLGFSRILKEMTGFTSDDFNLAASVSLNTKKFGSLRIGGSASSFTYGFDFSKSTFGDMINPKLGFIYPTLENVPSMSYYELDAVPIYNAGIFYSFKNHFYAGYSVLNINEPVLSLYQDDHVTMHSKTILTLGGRVNIKKDFDLLASAMVENSSYFELTQISPSIGVGYKCRYYFNTGIKVADSDFISYYFQLNADVIRCINLAFTYELLYKNYFSNALSPSYWSVGAGFYFDRFLKVKK